MQKRGARAGRHRLLSWDVEPGDAIVFDAMIVHGQMTPSTRHAETEASRAAQAADEADSTPTSDASSISALGDPMDWW